MKVHKVSHCSLSTDNRNLNRILENQDAVVLGRKDNLMV